VAHNRPTPPPARSVCSIDKPATAEEAIQAAKLDWKVKKLPLYATDGDNSLLRLPVPDKFAVARENSLDVLGVVGTSYTAVQNREAFAFFDPIVGDKAAIYHAAGALGREHDVVVGFTKLGDVQAAARALPKALQSYEEALVIQQRLAADDPTNAGWQRDLAETQDKAGQMLEAQENVPEALLRYHKALTIYETLAAQSPADDSLQSLVASVSYHLGRAAARQQPPDTSAARAALERACQILRHLQAANGASFSTEQAAMLDEATSLLSQHL
jgi:tetratricopeptide (TPR) repeat protein